MLIKFELSLAFLNRYLTGLSKKSKIAIAIAADAIALFVVASFVIAIDSAINFPHFQVSAVLAVIVFQIALMAVGGYNVVVRFVGIDFVTRALIATVATAIFLLAALHWQYLISLPSSAPILFACLGFFALMYLRLSAKVLLFPNAGKKGNTRSNVLIYGAGQAGIQLAHALHNHHNFQLAGFVDDRPGLQGRYIFGVKVFSPGALAELRDRSIFDSVLLAMPSLSRLAQRALLEKLEPLAVKVLVMPGLDELASGSKRVDELRQVQIEDLLKREPVSPIAGLLDRCIADKAVLVTGGGGSIGSEIARQVLRCGAKRLVILDVSEFALYQIDRELRAQIGNKSCEIVPVLGSVLDASLVATTLRRHRIETVYHAAAYKHVPLVEDNIVSALQNNVFGTLNAVRESALASVKNFVLVSTDKAVRPTSVMGASKRACELIVQAMAPTNPQMRSSIVRFGNVLASSGSVIPVFLDQIRSGGPVTVTHPEVTRYFMTIPEAAQLVIQAGAMGGNGEVFVLDMGLPVKIRLLAERMIHLSGLQVREPGSSMGDIEIQYTGLRPGEKLYEELLIGESPEATAHSRIFKAYEAYLDWPAMEQWLAQLKDAMTADCVVRSRQLLSEVVSGFPAWRIQSVPARLESIEAVANLRGAAS